jgi:glutaredoxin 2
VVPEGFDAVDMLSCPGESDSVMRSKEFICREAIIFPDLRGWLSVSGVKWNRAMD